MLFLALAGIAWSPARAAEDAALAAALKARTQAMMDAVAAGDTSVWEAAADPALIYVSENGEVDDRARLLAEMKPLPPGLEGHIVVTDYRLQRHGETAVATYVDDETLDYHGQVIKTKFRTTDTWHQRADGWTLVGSQVLAVLNDPPAITLPPAALSTYAGRYALTPDITYTIRAEDREGTVHLFGKREGGKEVELKAEAPDLFFVAGAPRSRKVFFRDAKGSITGFGDRREGNDVVWKRLP